MYTCSDYVTCTCTWLRMSLSSAGEKVAASSCSDGSSPEERATTTSSNEEEGEGEAGGTSDSSPSDNVDRANTEQQAHVPSSLGTGYTHTHMYCTMYMYNVCGWWEV